MLPKPSPCAPAPIPSASSELDRLTRILPGHPDLARELRRRPPPPEDPNERLYGEGGPGDRGCP
jgi:hypothetical protein